MIVAYKTKPSINLDHVACITYEKDKTHDSAHNLVDCVNIVFNFNNKMTVVWSFFDENEFKEVLDKLYLNFNK